MPSQKVGKVGPVDFTGVGRGSLTVAGDGVFDPDTPLGRDYAAVDWAATPLGDPHTWPRSLQAVVRMMVGVRFAIWIGWGPDLTFFCNDAYRHDTLRAKYPWALGRPTREVWAEIWDEVVPLFDSVMLRGESLRFEALQLFLERDGYPEETYHTFSYSPLFGDDGEVGGLFCVVSEDTAMVINQRRITVLRDLAAELTEARTEAGVLDSVQRVLAGAGEDLPFAVAYVLDPGDENADDEADEDERSSPPPTTAHLLFASGIEPGHAAAPPVLDLRRADGWAPYWPVDGTARTVEHLDRLFDDLPTGVWQRPPQRAVTVPLLEAGEDRPSGVLVVGANPHRVVDADYLGFVELVAGQVVAALSRARAFDAERERVRQMAELDRAKTEFFTNVSHELRTPLTLVLGPASDALTDGVHPLDDVQRDRLEVVARNGERLLKLVNTLLDFSRLEAGRVQAHLEPVDLGHLTAELVGLFEPAYRRAGLTLRLDAEPLPGAVLVDREMWSKIVLNLLSNALKATFEGGVQVALSAGADDGAVTLTVTDSGIGIPPAEQERLFERFHRVAGAALRTHEGSGIGLALVAELAELHGGTVAVSSSVGAGSVFTVTLPGNAVRAPGAAPVATAPAENGPVTGGTGPVPTSIGTGYLAEALRWIDDAPAPADARGADGAAGSGHRILVVDDNPDMRDYVTGILRFDYVVTTATDGAAALELARADPPDMVLTDIMMPVLDGFGLLRELRADPRTLHVPVVMLSARSGEDAAVEGLEAGADDYLVKPFSQRELVARVRAGLELDRVRRVADELERSRSMLAYAEQIALIGSFDYEIAADRLVATPQYLALLGVDADMLRTNALAASLALVHPDDRDAAGVAAGRSLTTGAPLDLEFRVGERTLWLRASVDLDTDGTPVRVRGTAQDVTVQRRAAAAEQAAAEARSVAARESAIARELQESLLPAAEFDADHLDVAGYYRAGVEGTQVGGDWYDVIGLDAGRTAMVLGDVMGRGVAAAAVMGQLRAAVRAYSRLELPPDVVLHLLDDSVRDIGDDMIVTCVYAVYDPADHTLTYAGAGHLPPLLARPGQPVVRLTAGGPPLGTGRAWGTPETVELPVGSTLVMYTDGLVEQRGADLDDGIDRVARLLERPTVDIESLPSRLTGELLQDGQDDDVAILVARVSERSGADRSDSCFFDSDVSVVSVARDWTTGVLRGWDVPTALVEDAELIVSELVTNAIVHGTPPVEVRLRLGGGRVLMEVLDSAVTTPQLRHAKPTDDHGRGLFIMSVLAERWGTRPTVNGKSVWCHLRL
ncbi:SpoIIE family protein phosphatase [Jatrophihabitans endophyticus]|uniref:SpoIIE family protein phosphatase n=1 Tax=Jatrophihabitans endophyticus TaxID=1206085 RepID=UPI0019F809DF|nr:SpoIIE family protein phosphatase [Jatrophihabitans endophyticus]MBE7187423.1 SpoIIE family protein phosphatase [Jatrophihabitans endophyticus]